MAGDTNRRSGSARRSRSESPYEELSRQNQEGHREVERLLKEAEEAARAASRGARSDRSPKPSSA